MVPFWQILPLERPVKKYFVTFFRILTLDNLFLPFFIPYQVALKRSGNSYKLYTQNKEHTSNYRHQTVPAQTDVYTF